MLEIEFSASVQMAIDWVNRYLIYPSDPNLRPVPKRADRGWITSIRAGEATPVDAPSPDIKVLERIIYFHVGTRPVVRICMKGVRHYRNNRPIYTEWIPAEVEYRTNWSQKEGSTHREELSGFATDLSHAIAPSDD